MALGICLIVEDFTASVTGPGTWSASAGTFTATLPAKGSCEGGGGTPADSAKVVLTVKGCGQLRISATATGYTSATRSTASAGKITGVGTWVALSSPGGGSIFDDCPVAPMIGKDGDTLGVNCGMQIQLQLGRDSFTNMGEITATFTLEAVYE